MVESTLVEPSAFEYTVVVSTMIIIELIKIKCAIKISTVEESIMREFIVIGSSIIIIESAITESPQSTVVIGFTIVALVRYACAGTIYSWSQLRSQGPPLPLSPAFFAPWCTTL